MNSGKRIDWIDFAKGIAILLVIIGHTTGTGMAGNIIHYNIFSFHMPLFFILSGYTFKFSTSTENFRQKTKISAKRLLIPFLVTYVILILWQNDITVFYSLDFWKQAVVTFLYTGVGITYNGVQGFWLYTWFFVALFVSRTVFDYLHLVSNDKGIFTVLCCLGSLVGFVIGKVQLLPFSMDIGLISLLFLYAGYYLKNVDLTDKMGRKIVISLAIWLITFWLVQTDLNNLYALDMANRYYPLYPLCVVTAIAGTLAVVEISIIICKKGKAVTRPFSYLGENSLYLLCIHSLDGKLDSLWWVGSSVNQCARRLALDLVVFGIVMLFKDIIGKYKDNKLSN